MVGGLCGRVEDKGIRPPLSARKGNLCEILHARVHPLKKQITVKHMCISDVALSLCAISA
jgi:hypothetical protein